MAGWTAASLFPSSTLKNAIASSGKVPPSGVLTPQQKLQLSGGITRQALAKHAATTPSAPVIPASTSGGNAAMAIPEANPAAVTPSFLQSDTSNNQQDLTDLLQQILGANRPDPDLVNAQTVLAQQQAMEVARGNQAARERESNQAAQGYLQGQLRDLKYSPFDYTGNKQTINDKLKLLQSGQNLNWYNSPSYSYIQPKRSSGWTGPSMPTPGFGF